MKIAIAIAIAGTGYVGLSNAMLPSPVGSTSVDQAY